MALPRYGTLTVESSGDVLWRSDSIRPLNVNTLELKLGEIPTASGDYILPPVPSVQFSRWLWGDLRRPVLLSTVSPPIERMINRHLVSAFSFRADTATYSNNGGSTHCTISLDDVPSATAELSPPLLPGLHPWTFSVNR